MIQNGVAQSRVEMAFALVQTARGTMIGLWRKVDWGCPLDLAQLDGVRFLRSLSLEFDGHTRQVQTQFRSDFGSREDLLPTISFHKLKSLCIQLNV